MIPELITPQRNSQVNSCSLASLDHHGGESMQAPQVVFTEILFELLDRKGIDILRHFAMELEIPPTTVYQWTYTKAVVHEPQHVFKLCKYFGVSYEYLMFGIGLDPEELDEICERQAEKIKQLENSKAMLEAQLAHLQQELPMFDSNAA